MIKIQQTYQVNAISGAEPACRLTVLQNLKNSKTVCNYHELSTCMYRSDVRGPMLITVSGYNTDTIAQGIL